MASLNRTQLGFTLIEAVMVMVISGILGALVASFAGPIKGYFDATARAELSDVADTTLRRMARELHAALPNSVRASGGYIEFLPTVTGGRYRKDQDCSNACTGDILNFAATDTGFDVIGALSATPVPGQEVVVYNTDAASVYAGNNVATINAGSTTSYIAFAAKQFPFESPGKRFQIIDKPVTFACEAATSTLWRYTGYSRQIAQPTTIATLDALPGVTRARLATGVDCAASSFVYMAGVTQRGGLVTMRLALTNSALSANNESLALLHQVHVQNVP